ncbi:ABC transporter permease [Alphaproteobacteria bacterium]|jgi:putative hydroxymethylpyrimidine transport system permease protein|nr:ABC transporter permease [Alphaproteobacteria bacterium]MDC1055671.1 ABC transporter permease [bacterium]
MLRGLIIAATIFAIWEFSCVYFSLPPFMLPPPSKIFISIYTNWDLLIKHASYTLVEILASIFIGTIIGVVTALTISSSERLKRWVMPILLASQSIPVFALAPLLILWLGYGMSSKIVIGVLIVFFPITSNFTDALNKVPQELIDAGKTIGLSKTQVFWKIKIPSSLPGLCSGIRVAACFAPIGAVVGEWIGGSTGLGSFMIYSNARLQTDNMFAALIILIFITITLYKVTDMILSKYVWWK